MIGGKIIQEWNQQIKENNSRKYYCSYHGSFHKNNDSSTECIVIETY